MPSLQFGDASQDDDNDDEVVEEGDPLDAMTSNYDEDDTSLDAIDNASSSSASKAHQLANKTKSKLLCKPSDNEVSIVATSDDTDKITIIHKSKHPQGEQQSGDNSIGERKEGKQSKSLEMDWDATLMELQKNELTGFTSTSPSSDDNDLNATKASGGLEDEEDFDELAGMLMGQTTLLSSSNGRKWGDSFADRRAMIKAGAAASQQLQQEEIQKERDGLSSERNDEEMSVEAPTLEEEESDDLDELTLGYLEVEKSRIEDMLGDSLNEEDAENASEIQSKEKDSTTHSIDPLPFSSHHVVSSRQLSCLVLRIVQYAFVSHWHFAMLFVNHPLFWLCLIEAFHTRCSPFQALLWSVGSPLLSHWI